MTVNIGVLVKLNIPAETMNVIVLAIFVPSVLFTVIVTSPYAVIYALIIIMDYVMDVTDGGTVLLINIGMKRNMLIIIAKK